MTCSPIELALLCIAAGAVGSILTIVSLYRRIP